MRLAATTALSLWGITAGGILATPASAQTTAAPYQTGYRWDAMRRIVGIISPDPDGTGTLPFPAVRYTYDVDGQLTKTEKGTLAAWAADTVLPASWSGFTVIETTTVTYDAGGRKIRETVTAGGATQKITDFSYDADDRALCTTERMNLSSPPTNACSLSSPTPSDGADRITKNVYDLAGQLVQIRKAVGTSIEQGYVTYSYTANGKQAYIIDANGNRAQQTYDDYDRVYRWIFPSTTRPSAYNPASQATALSTAGSVNNADYEQYTYDKSNNRTAIRKRDASTLTFQYNAGNLLTTKVVPSRTGTPSTATRDVYYGYDLRGLKRFARFDSAAGADGVIYTYDALGRLVTSATAMDGVTRTLTYQYDRDGKRTTLGFPDSKYFSYAYDYLDRMTGVFEGQTQNTRRITIAYDSAGRRSGLTRTAQDITSYAYDAASRLHILTHAFSGSTGGVQLTFTYNNIGQIKSRASNNASYDWSGDHDVTRPYTTDGLNRYSAAGPASFTYDGNGNLLSDGTVTYTYDVENRVLSASGGLTASVRYDAEGRLYEVSGHRFLYDGDALVAEYNTAGTLLDRYIHGPRVDEPLIWYEGSSLTSANYYHADHQGSIISFSTATGTFRALRTYDSYGFGDAANNELGRFSYTGQIWIHDLGTYYYKARAYSPSLGRFLQTDPVGYGDQYNLYSYVANDPIDGRDPTGKNCVEGPCVNKIAEDEVAHPLHGVVAAGVAVGAPLLLAATPEVAGGIVLEGATAETATAAEAATAAETATTSTEASSANSAGARTLRANMRAAGREPGPGQAAHHIVAQGAKRAAPARGVLERSGIGIHSEVNGVGIDGDIHAGIHTNSYYDAVNDALTSAEAKGSAAVEKVLRGIADLFK